MKHCSYSSPPSRLRYVALTSLVIPLWCPSLTTFSQTPVVFATGVDANGAVTGKERSVDLHYTVRVPGSNAEAQTYIYRRAFNDNQTYTPWIKNNATSAWISAIQVNTIEQAGGYFASADGAPGDYFYTLTFDMTGLDPTTLTFTGRWAADDQGMFIYLNGWQMVNTGTGLAVAPAGAPAYDPHVGFNHWMQFWLCEPGNPCGPSSNVYPGDGFFSPSNVLPGMNKLTFHVHNVGGPTGLRVEIQGNAMPLAKRKAHKSRPAKHK
jgi:hypothetical protein